jgi:uncharacterized protein (DUF1330 family)
MKTMEAMEAMEAMRGGTFVWRGGYVNENENEWATGLH